MVLERKVHPRKLSRVFANGWDRVFTHWDCASAHIRKSLFVSCRCIVVRFVFCPCIIVARPFFACSWEQISIHIYQSCFLHLLSALIGPISWLVIIFADIFSFPFIGMQLHRLFSVFALVPFSWKDQFFPLATQSTSLLCLHHNLFGIRLFIKSESPTGMSLFYLLHFQSTVKSVPILTSLLDVPAVNMLFTSLPLKKARSGIWAPVETQAMRPLV